MWWYGLAASGGSGGGLNQAGGNAFSSTSGGGGSTAPGENGTLTTWGMEEMEGAGGTSFDSSISSYRWRRPIIWC